MKYIVKYGSEVSIKSDSIRKNFVRLIGQNIRAACSVVGEKCEIQHYWSFSILYVETPLSRDHPVLNVFGIHSVTAVDFEIAGHDLDGAIEAAKKIYPPFLKDKTFSVRIDKHRVHGLPSSGSMERQFGSELSPFAQKVRLKNPDICIRFTILKDRILLNHETILCSAGLPLGSQGRALLMYSGGFDSPVAAWHLLRRGVMVDFVYFSFGGNEHESIAIRNLRSFCKRWCHGYKPSVYSVPFEECVDEIKSSVKPNYNQIALKFMMYHGAGVIQKSSRVKYSAIATGEAIGQVSSQTLLNLQVLDKFSPVPILRPLLCAEKNEVIDTARRIGTAKGSAEIKEVCHISGVHKPITNAKIKDFGIEISKLNMGILVESFRNVSPQSVVLNESSSSLAVDFVQVSRPLADLEKNTSINWIDCRLSHISLSDPLGPDFLAIAFESIDYSKLSREEAYVFVCTFGIDSAIAAQNARRFGIERAFSLQGGRRVISSGGKND